MSPALPSSDEGGALPCCRHGRMRTYYFCLVGVGSGLCSAGASTPFYIRCCMAECWDETSLSHNREAPCIVRDRSRSPGRPLVVDAGCTLPESPTTRTTRTTRTLYLMKAQNPARCSHRLRAWGPACLHARRDAELFPRHPRDTAHSQSARGLTHPPVCRRAPALDVRHPCDPGSHL